MRVYGVYLHGNLPSSRSVLIHRIPRLAVSTSSSTHSRQGRHGTGLDTWPILRALQPRGLISWESARLGTRRDGFSENSFIKSATEHRLPRRDSPLLSSSPQCHPCYITPHRWHLGDRSAATRVRVVSFHRAT